MARHAVEPPHPVGAEMRSEAGDAISSARRRAMVIALNFPPDGSVGTMRTVRLVRHLVEAGWHVDVLTGDPVRYRAGTVVDAALLEKVPSSVRVIRARAWRPVERLNASLRPKAPGPSATPPPSRPGGDASRAPRFAHRLLGRMLRAAGAALAIPDREVSWLLPGLAAAWRVARRSPPDVVFASGPPFTAHLAGLLLARLTRRPFVAEFRDPWARAPWRDDRFAFERRAWSILEGRFVRGAEAVVFVTETNKEDFARQYGPDGAARFHVIPNGCDPADFDGLPQRHGGERRFVLLHAGSLYGARNPSPLLRALARLFARGALDRSAFCVRFIGRVGAPGTELFETVRSLGLEDVVEFVEHMPRRAVLQEMLAASALLIVQPVTLVSVPAKLYEYMAAGRPVLALAEPEGETAAVIERSRAGLVVSSDDERGLEEALQSIVALAPAFVPSPPETYDGGARARQVGLLLADVVERRERASASRSVAALHPPEVKRS